MPIPVTRLTPGLAAQIDGVDVVWKETRSDVMKLLRPERHRLDGAGALPGSRKMGRACIPCALRSLEVSGHRVRATGRAGGPPAGDGGCHVPKFPIVAVIVERMK